LRRSRQGHLFGEPPPKKRAGAEVAPADPGEDLARLAERVPDRLRLGTSSWSFPGWRGIVWADEASSSVLARRGLSAYASHPLLRAVGVDRTFYAPVESSVLRAYADSVPEDFRFVVKAPAAVTSPYKLGAGRGAREPNPTWLDPSVATGIAVAPFVEGLGEKAGALVLQFPPLGRAAREPERFADRLGRFLERLPPGPVYAVELRNRELAGEPYRQALRATGATHCVSVHPRMPSPDRQAALVDPGGPLVVRWMLHSGLEYDDAKERYAPFDALVDEDPDIRESLATLALSALEIDRDVIVIANNKAEGSAPLTVFRLAGRVVDRLET
jgi:uncharacterized protein YecE (DUF72 family)